MKADRIIPRAQGIFEYLLGQLDKWVPMEMLVADMNRRLGDNVGGQTYRAAALYLKSFMCPRGYDVHVSTKHGFRLEEINRTRYAQRTLEHPKLKLGLGYVLWDWLLNIDANEEERLEHSASHQEQVLTKLGSLRSKTILTIIADTGSTVGAVVRAPLNVNSIPIVPRIFDDASEGGNHRETQSRFITPHIITNGLSIATMVSESRHANAITLSIIGGRFQPEFSSICGRMADQCLEAWGGGGTWKCDLAMLGTTGCWTHPDGVLGFSSDGDEEARIKARLLEMAFFRVVVMDSSKLTASPSGNIFASLSAAALDLVVIDDGNTTDTRENVVQFSTAAERAGVTVLTLKTKPARNNSAG
jgi:DeoR/GlpR family transcriptional regulator of sugar metabolism